MIYPERLPARVGRLVLDILAVLWTGVWALVGWQVYSLVIGLEVVADGITSAGNNFNSWIKAFREATPHNVPGLSGFLADIANGLQRSGGDPLVRNGLTAHARIQQLALLLGVIIGFIPFLAVTGTYLLWRVRDAQEMAATEDFVRAARATGRLEAANAVLAHRAVAVLPFRKLMRVSQDPVGDLASGRHDALAAAMLRRAGMYPLSGSKSESRELRS